ncbi:MAG: prenyltransferase/squalene oxidase repeat-containing protein [Pirellulaceae bacterium]|nr:prenyltransferase/squalene oxidase repeat-containing protein [Pirellulaceae bacterium]
MEHPKDDLSNLDLGLTKDAFADLPSPLEQAAPGAQLEVDEPIEELRPSRKWLALSVPAWLVSMLVHIAMIQFMAAYHLPGIGKAVSAYIVNASAAEESDSMEDFSIEEAMAMEAPKVSEKLAPTTTPTLKNVVSENPLELDVDVVSPSMASIQLSSLSSEMIASSLSSGEQSMKKALASRSTQSKRELLDRYGGNQDTEKAVAAALKWFAQHQMPDGSWTFAHGLACGGKCKDGGGATGASNAATGLALMCFLGAGQTHLEGDYKESVFKGLSYLLRNMQVTDGKMPSWYNKGRGSSTGVMYSHGIASIAMCEAYGMSKDPALKAAAQASINFIVYAQDPSGGGWYYSPRAGGDTSVVGWQLMALKSAAMSGLNVPTGTIKKAERYLDSVSSDNGSSFGYRKSGDRPKVSAMAACGILCKMYMGLPKDDPGLVAASEGFAEKGMDSKDVYYNYYATQVMKQVGGALWAKWDEKMKKVLLTTQEQSGHVAGSWHNGAVKHADAGGRLYQTAMATMMLEVYYRYMPIYAVQAEDEAFKL